MQQAIPDRPVFRRAPLWKRPEVISLFLALLVVLVTASNSWRSFQAFRTNRELAILSRDIAEGTRFLLASVLEAETGERGYLLTGNHEYLQPFERASASIPGEIAKLRALGDRDPLEKENIAGFTAVVELKLSELKETIRLRDSDGPEAALAMVMTDSGRNAMSLLRSMSSKISGAQFGRLNERSQIIGEITNRSFLLNAIGNLILVSLLVYASVMIHRGSRRREQLIGVLQEDDRRLRELRLHAEESEGRVRTILESITDAFVSFDRDWKMKYVNPEAERILHRSRQELLGQPYWEQLPATAGAQIEEKYRNAIETQTPLSFEIFLTDQSVWWEQNIYPSRDGGLSVYFRDITERKRLEERSRHSQKLESLGILAGGIAHDFNNLLTAILGSASLALEDLAEDSTCAPLLRNVIAASERAAQLTRQMLAYSGRGRFMLQNIDLGSQVKEFADLLKTSVSPNVELILKLSAEGIFIEADAGQIQQLIMNLVINGAEAVGEGHGSVVIATSPRELDEAYVRDHLAGDDIKPGSFILLEVHDTGCGMDQATLDRIFDPFFTTKFTGRGLGLAAVLGIVRGHKGAIRVYSHPGSGTTFKVFFPAVESSNENPGKREAMIDYRGTATILVVDDEQVVQRTAQTTLEHYGYRVLTAANGKEAMEVFARDPEAIGLVLLDMTMPVMSGEETLVAMKKIQPDVRVIVSSGYNEIEALRRFGSGVNGFLQKPYRAGQLAEKVKLSLQT